LVEGNAYIDQVESAVSTVSALTPLQQTHKCQAFFHQSTSGLQAQFDITKAEARAKVAACPHHAHISPIQDQGVNPRGLQPRQIWQSDITEFPPFGKLKYVPVATCSQAIWATSH
ncbi:POK25 protein, partial [Urocolius indicus]|nr:POK25 protein [Urocolius indicus]